jgi:hypothetical protein
MVWLMKWLVLGHIHKWKTIAVRPFRLTERGRVTDTGERHIQQCETCGLVVKRDLI